MNNEELKPCPFCGGKAHLLIFNAKSYVKCERCEIETPHKYWSEEEAIAVWNRRNYSVFPNSSNLTYADVEKMVKLNYHEYKEPRYCYWGETDSIAGMYFKIKTVDGADDLPAWAIELYKEDEDGSIDFLTDYQTLHSAIEAAQEWFVDLVADALGVERKLR